MPHPATYVLIWSLKDHTYGLFDQDNKDHPLLQAEGEVWLTWLASHPSFTFQGQHGPVSLQKERRPRGREGYWYAYRRQGKRMVKHYLGPSRNLTIERLEAAAHALGASRDLVSTFSRARRRDSLAHMPALTTPEQELSLLAPKLHPPRLRPFLIARDRLLSQLSAGLERKLTLVCASAGFGKTTLVRQWIDARAHQLGAIAWVSLEAEDNDPIRFWRYVLTACQVFRSDLGRSALALLSAEHIPFAQPSFKIILTLFLNEAIQLEQQHILVLEDYHVITEPSIHEAVTFLVDHLPSSLHLVVITRSEPALPLVRWRASGELCEVQAHDLRFSAEEVQVFLQQALSFPLAPDMSRYLETHLEGWATGLHLLTLAFQGQSQPHEVEQVLTTFTGGHRYVLHYFVDEVLATQPEPLHTFLLQTSLLSRLTASLCDAVTGRDDSEYLLEEVERSGLFLLPLEGAGSWYRYHAPFAEAMRAEARRRLGTDALGACLDRASLWYEQQEMLPEAIETTLAAHNSLRAADLIERSIGMALSQEAQEMHTLRRWLGQIAEIVIHRRPTLCFTNAIVLLFTSEHTTPELRAQVDMLLDMAEHGWRSEANTVKLGEICAFRALLAVRQGESCEAEAFARQALIWLPKEQFLWRSICLGAIGEEKRRVGQLGFARKALLEALSLCEAAANRHGTRVTLLMVADVYREQGELHQAAEFYQQVLFRGEDDLTDKARALIGLADISYEWNALEQAKRAAQEAFDLGLQLTEVSMQVHAALLLLRVYCAEGAFEQARLLLADLLKWLLPMRWPLLYQEVRTAQARLHLAQGDLSAVERSFTSLFTPIQRSGWQPELDQTQARGGEEQDDDVPQLQRERKTLLLARWLLTQGGEERAQEALSLLARQLEMAQQAARSRSALEILLLMSLAYRQRGQEEDTRRALHEVLVQAAPEGYLRLFLDEGESLLAALRALVPHLHAQSLLTYVRSILLAFGAATLHTPRAGAHASQSEKPTAAQALTELEAPSPSALVASACLPEPLSPQELCVLQLLAANLSRQEIAEALVISMNTAKTHLQHIYRKLGVGNRAQACAAAHDLHLL